MEDIQGYDLLASLKKHQTNKTKQRPYWRHCSVSASAGKEEITHR